MTNSHFVTTPLASKRDRTRNALLIAAQHLCLENPGSPLTVSAVTGRADMAHGTFYNHFESIENLLDGIGLLLLAEHSRLIASVTAGLTDPVSVFALSTRQTLRLVTDGHGYGLILFDSGLPVDRFLGGLRYRMGTDVLEGLRSERFRVHDAEVAISMIAGSVLGVALDLHRTTLRPSAIESATERMLTSLGVNVRTAARVAHEPFTFVPPRPLPLTSLPHTLSSRQEGVV